MKPGETTLQLINELVKEGVEHIVLLMRHSAREYVPGRHDLLNPLTDEGRDLARSLGGALPKLLKVRGYSSPPERCIETATLIKQAHEEGGGLTTRNRVVEGLGVFYVLDQMKMFMAMQEVGGMVNFQRDWFSGNVSPDILIPADASAQIIAKLALQKLKEKPSHPQLDLMVSHDFTIYLLKDRLLGQNSTIYPDVIYLDGIAVFERDGKAFMQSHHEPAVELKL